MVGRLKALPLLAATLLIWSLQDILVWYLFIERRRLDHDIGIGNVYQQAHQAVLVALTVAGVLWLSRHRWVAAWYAAATWTLAYSGLCDLLYYWLAGRGLPGTFPWLDGSGHILVLFHPATGARLLESAGVWAAAWLLCHVILELMAALRERPPARLRAATTPAQPPANLPGA